MSRAPSFPVDASASRPSRASLSSSSLGLMVAAEVGSITAMGECVNERCNFAVNINFGFTATLRTPKLGQLRLDVPVKRRVDLDHIETLRQKFEGMAFPALHTRRIKDSVPIFIAPTGRADANLGECVHGRREQLQNCRLAQGKRRLADCSDISATGIGNGMSWERAQTGVS